MKKIQILSDNFTEKEIILVKLVEGSEIFPEDVFVSSKDNSRWKIDHISLTPTKILIQGNRLVKLSRLSESGILTKLDLLASV